MEALQYPIGRFEMKQDYSPEEIKRFINDIRYLPSLVEIAIQDLDEHQLQTPYRPGGWTVAQVVHHLADSHINAVTRLKLALTEDKPVIKPYEEDRWAELPDVAHTPVNVSITLLHALHTRWVNLYDHLAPELLQRTFIHPASGIEYNLKGHIANYSWHGRHHLAHITGLKERMGW
ncbi:YfiT family bacillithiol transferase [Chitinophaga vietnamensis]|uniref:YfiT family bacillithiol transferase n=1 Tax=Chitinophaga vietnamensis TaxID=2593957 RepID=UPI00117809EE|nr:putative metal-dependent hydrolase [Chitinophaga vietnamensis]